MLKLPTAPIVPTRTLVTGVPLMIAVMRKVAFMDVRGVQVVNPQNQRKIQRVLPTRHAPTVFFLPISVTGAHMTMPAMP